MPDRSVPGFTSYINEVFKDMDKIEKQHRAKASKLAQDTIKTELAAAASLHDLRLQARKSGAGGHIDGPPGMLTGTLYVNIDKYDGRQKSYAGAMYPAAHAHLLEFGHFVKSKIGAIIGWSRPCPFVEPAFEKIAGQIEDILSDSITPGK